THGFHPCKSGSIPLRATKQASEKSGAFFMQNIYLATFIIHKIEENLPQRTLSFFSLLAFIKDKVRKAESIQSFADFVL
ncbi:hypothetical protein DBR27_00790, partial [Flavobacterium sp. HMWF030]